MSIRSISPEIPVRRAPVRSAVVLAIVCGAIFLEGIDIGMFNVALPSIRADLALETAQLHWIISAYVLGYGGFVLLGGRLADLLGKRRIFLVALTVFVVFTAIGGFSADGWMLIVARAVTGVAAAFMAPAGLSIITTTFPEGARRNRAVLIYSGVGAGGFTIGLVLGGLLTLLGWRWVFFAPFVVAALLLAIALPLLPRAADRITGSGRVDWMGAVTLTSGLVLLVLGIEQLPTASVLSSALVLGLSVLMITAFVVIQSKSVNPLLRLSILRNGPLVRASLGAALLSAAFLGFQFIVVLYLQDLRGWTALETSLAMLVMGVDVVLAPLLTPLLVSRFGVRKVAVSGLAFAVLGYSLFLPMAANWDYWAMFPSLLAVGFAFTLAYGPLTIAATESVGEEEQGLAGGLLYTSFQFGGAIGLSAVTALLLVGDGGDQLETYRLALVAPVVIAVLAVGIMAVRRRGTRRSA